MKKVNISDLISNNKFEDEEYIKLYSTYHSMITKYLSEKLGLSILDKRIGESNLNYISVKEEDMDTYQYLSSDDMNYFYLRNDVHLDRLDEKEISFLRTQSNNEEIVLNEEIIKFVESTMSKTLSSLIDEPNTYATYGPISGNYMVPSNSLVIGFRYDEFNKGGMTDEEWDMNHDEKMFDIMHVFELLEKGLSDFKIMPVEVIQYNNYSVKKKQSDKSNLTM